MPECVKLRIEDLRDMINSAGANGCTLEDEVFAKYHAIATTCRRASVDVAEYDFHELIDRARWQDEPFDDDERTDPHADAEEDEDEDLDEETGDEDVDGEPEASAAGDVEREEHEALDDEETDTENEDDAE